jgi:hypothetical protein
MREHIVSVCALVLAILLSTVARAQPGWGYAHQRKGHQQQR